jgi:hypothetical protein
MNGEPERSERAMPKELYGAIFDLGYEADWSHEDGCVDPAVFSAEEIARCSETERKVCVECKDARVDSRFLYVCHEGVARRLKGLPIDERLKSVELLENRCGDLAIQIQTHWCHSIDDLLRVALLVFTRLGGKRNTIVAVEAYHSCPWLMGTSNRLYTCPETVTQKEKETLYDSPFFNPTI